MIRIESDRIVEVGTTVAIPPGARIVDLGDATLLPGLIDLHTDLTGDARQYSLYVETPLVRNLADGPDEVTKAVRTNLKNGAVLSKGITPGSGPGRSVRLRMRDSAARLPRAFR